MSEVPAIVYAAKSTADVRNSLATQIADCEQAIEREGGRRIVAIFQEEAASGFHGNRGDQLAEAKARAVKEAAAHGGAELWVQHSSRFARGAGDSPKAADHLLEVFFAMRRQNVELRSVEDDSAVRTLVLAAVTGDQNHQYSKRLSEAVSKGKQRQLERGERMGGPVLDGQLLRVERNDRDEVVARRYLRDPERAPIIEALFALAEAGHGDGVIARMLNAKGYRTRDRVMAADSTKTGRKKGDIVPGGPWTRRRVQDTVTNPSYAGRVVRNRHTAAAQVVEAVNVEPLISGERFDAIQAQRAERDRSLAGRDAAKRRGALGGAPTLRYALSRLATCARCGRGMYCVTSPYKRKDGSQARQYVCTNVHTHTGICDAPKVNAERADAAIVPYLAGFFDNYAAWIESVKASAGSEEERAAAALDDARERLAKLEAAEPRAHERYMSALAEGEDATADAALAALTKIKSDRTELAAEVDRLQAQVDALQGSGSDAMVEYWRGVAAGIRGRLESAAGLSEINAELRVALQRVDIDTRPDGALELRAIYRHRGSIEPLTQPILDADGLIPDDPDFEVVGEGNFVPDDVLIVSPKFLGKAGGDPSSSAW